MLSVQLKASLHLSCVTICRRQDSLLALALHEFANELLTVLPSESAPSVLQIVLPVACVDATVLELKDTIAIF